jgi:threonine/homoserine/homoserine lactone efflux protein
MSAVIEGMLAGYGIAIPVGAVSILIVNASMQADFRIGFMAGAGAASADFLYAVLAGVTGTAVTALLQPIAPALRIISGLVLIGLGATAIAKGIRSAGSIEKQVHAAGPLGTFVKFLGITLINPLTVVYFTALVLGRSPSARLGISAQVFFALGAGIASLSWQTLLAGLGGIARNRLSQRFRVWATILGNLLVLGLGVRVLILAVGLRG